MAILSSADEAAASHLVAPRAGRRVQARRSASGKTENTFGGSWKLPPCRQSAEVGGAVRFTATLGMSAEHDFYTTKAADYS
jgi:hypothetical protein